MNPSSNTPTEPSSLPPTFAPNELPNVQKREQENRCEIHPDDADALGIADGDRVRLRSEVGAIELPAEVSDRVRRGIVCVPHGWGSGVFSPTDGAAPIVHGVNRNLLVDNRVIDPFSGTPNLNSTRVAVERVAGSDPGPP
jgi:formate dehydrogenase